MTTTLYRMPVRASISARLDGVSVCVSRPALTARPARDSGGEDMRANRTIGIRDRDRTFKDGLKGLPDIKPLGLAADQHRHRLALARDLARRLGGGGGFARGRDGIELRLQLGLGGVPLDLQLYDPGGCLRLGALGLVPVIARRR